jgi:hypothetical protein
MMVRLGRRLPRPARRSGRTAVMVKNEEGRTLSQVRPSTLMLCNLRSPPQRPPNRMEIRLSASFKTQAAAVRKPASTASSLQRPSPELVRLLGGGDPAILVLRHDGAVNLLGGLTPPMLRVERGREEKTLMSAVTMAVAASLWPLIVLFEAGHGAVTRYAGRDIVAEVLS